MRRKYTTLLPGDVPEISDYTSEPDVSLDVPHRRYVLCGMAQPDKKTDDLFEGQLGRGFDPLTSEYVIPFCKRHDSCTTLLDRQYLAEDYPGLFWAFGIYDEASTARYRLEALLLGGATPTDAAEVMGVDESFVWWYEKVFFDIADKIKAGNRAWLADKVLVPAVYSGGKLIRENLMWKMISGLCGWRVFSQNNDGVLGPIDADILAKIDVLFNQSVKTGALTASRTMEINRFTRLELIDQMHRGSDVEVRRLASDVGDRDNNPVLDTMRAVLTGLKYSCSEYLAAKGLPATGPLADNLTQEFARRERINAERAVDDIAMSVPLADDT